MTSSRKEEMEDKLPQVWTAEARLPSAFAAIDQFLVSLLSALQYQGWAERDIFAIRLAVEEALVNAVRHGNESDNGKSVRVAYQLSPERFMIEIADEGNGFDPATVPDCTATENLKRPSGRGILLMRNYMSRVEYLDGGHRVVMEKHKVPRN